MARPEDNDERRQERLDVRVAARGQVQRRDAVRRQHPQGRLHPHHHGEARGRLDPVHLHHRPGQADRREGPGHGRDGPRHPRAAVRPAARLAVRHRHREPERGEAGGEPRAQLPAVALRRDRRLHGPERAAQQPDRPGAQPALLGRLERVALQQDHHPPGAGGLRPPPGDGVGRLRHLLPVEPAGHRGAEDDARDLRREPEGAGDGVRDARRLRATRQPAGPAGDQPAVPQRPVRVLGDEGDPRRPEQRPAGPHAVRGARDLQADPGRGEGQGPAAAGRGQAGHPAHLRVLHRPPQGAGAGAAEPAAADRAEAEPGREGLPGVRRRHLHPQAGVAAARHGVVVLVARVQQPVGLLLPDPVRGRDAEAEPVQRRLLRRTAR